MNRNDWINQPATPLDTALTVLFTLMMIGGIIYGFYTALKPVEESPVVEPLPIYETEHESGDEAYDIESVIRSIARANRVDEELALRIARCESTLNPSARNNTSSALGLYQFLEGTWEYIGSPGDRENPEDATLAFVTWYPRYPGWWSACDG